MMLTLGLQIAQAGPVQILRPQRRYYLYAGAPGSEEVDGRNPHGGSAHAAQDLRGDQRLDGGA